MSSLGKSNIPSLILPLEKEIIVKKEPENFWEDYYNKSVTPELLKHFPHEEALGLIKYFYRTPGAGTQGCGGTYSLRDLDIKTKSFLERELKGANIIEFGNKGVKQNYQLTPFKVKTYSGTDCDYGDDALTYLMKQPDKSAIVCSFGVVDSGVLDSFMGRDAPLGKYIDVLAKEIYRVTPTNAITLHGTDGFSELEKAGFTNKKVLHKASMGDILAYRKVEWIKYL